MRVGVVGAGVVGITSAIALLEKGINNVVLISKDQPLSTNSDAAVAAWYAPDSSKEKLQELCFDSLARFYALSREEGSGVHYIPIAYYFKDDEEYLQSGLYRAIHQGLINRVERDDAPVIKDYPVVVIASIPLADVPEYRPYLLSRFEALGGKISIQEIDSLETLITEYDVVINSSGWEAKRLARDEKVFPARGQTEVASLSQFPSDPLSLNVAGLDTYVVFRPGSKDCVMGTTYQINQRLLRPSAQDKAEIIGKASKLLPCATQLETRSIVGVRCGRFDVRLESELIGDTLVVHNYGHGGSGFSSSWGCAKLVLDMCFKHMQQSVPNRSLTARL